MFDRITEGRWWDKPWGLVSGCTPCSPGCIHCWALVRERRFCHGPLPVEIHPERLDLPLKKKPAAWAIWNDLFHGDVDWNFIEEAFGIMDECNQHIFLILTKRIERMKEFLTDWDCWMESTWPHVWLGVTVCNQDEAWKIDHLLKIPAAVHFVSHEPALGPVTYPKEFLELGNRAWLIGGGESGPGGRDLLVETVRHDRDQCQRSGVRFLFKHWGKRGAGRLLDGREWNEIPGL